MEHMVFKISDPCYIVGFLEDRFLKQTMLSLHEQLQVIQSNGSLSFTG